MRKVVVINREGDLGILCQRLELRSFRRGPQHDLSPIPMEPDGDNSRTAIRPDIGETGGNCRLQELFGCGMLQQLKTSLLDRHGSLLWYRGMQADWLAIIVPDQPSDTGVL